MAAARHSRRGTVDCIAEAFDLAATLQLRHLARRTSLTSRMLLALLDKNGPARLSELSATIGVSNPVITHSVGRMAREGLVIRTVDPADGRAKLVEITDAGRALRKDQRNEQHERMAEVLNTLSPEDVLALGSAMSEALPVLERLSRRAAAKRGRWRIATVLSS